MFPLHHLLIKDPSPKRRKLTERCTPFTVPVPEAYVQRVSEAGQGGGLQNKIQAVARAMQGMMEGIQVRSDILFQ